ncbi:hypothetical protein D7Y25_17010 [Parabacteroides goldsteinii]|nr:hypothetical protein [Parabacteroides goldsteinii]RLT84012.1 hypothetical protein D7Y25_17010 [Parabacteroides goldsteinii]
MYMELKHLTIVKDKRSNCLSCMGITTIQDYIKYIEDIYKIKGGIEGQRDALRTSSAIKIRKRMVEDIVKGTVLPPVVLGLLLSHEDFIKINTAEPNKDVILEILSNASDENISLIDGMQRTTAIIEAFKMSEDIANNDLRVEIWIVENLNNLMYRMLVLNTGQVPWTIRRQLEVVYGSLLKTIKNSVPEIEIYAIDDSKYRTDGGQYQGESIIELFIVFGSRKEKVNIKERVAEEFTRLDFIESTDKSDLLSMFIRCLQIMYKVDKAFTRFESQNKTGKFAEGKDLFKSQPARIGFMAALAIEIFGRPGNDRGEEAQLKILNRIENEVDDFIALVDKLTKEELEAFLALNILNECLNDHNPSKVGDFERTFFKEAFYALIQEHFNTQSMVLSWRAY